MQPIDQDEYLRPHDSIVVCVCREGELPFDARTAEGGKGVCDALCQHRVCVMPVAFCRSRIDAVDVVEPGARRVTLEAMERPAMYHLDGAKLVHRHWQQHTRCGTNVAIAVALRLDEASALDDHDRHNQHHQQ
jgi:hypothetical protein